MKPSQYWIHTGRIDKLTEQFGPTLDGYDNYPGLTRREKISLRSLLSMWMSLRELQPEMPISGAYACIESAWQGACLSEYAMCTDDVMKAISILDGITCLECNELLRALSEQIAATK